MVDMRDLELRLQSDLQELIGEVDDVFIVSINMDIVDQKADCIYDYVFNKKVYTDNKKTFFF